MFVKNTKIVQKTNQTLQHTKAMLLFFTGPACSRAGTNHIYMLFVGSNLIEYGLTQASSFC